MKVQDGNKYTITEWKLVLSENGIGENENYNSVRSIAVSLVAPAVERGFF